MHLSLNAIEWQEEELRLRKQWACRRQVTECDGLCSAQCTVHSVHIVHTLSPAPVPAQDCAQSLHCAVCTLCHLPLCHLHLYGTRDTGDRMWLFPTVQTECDGLTVTVTCTGEIQIQMQTCTGEIQIQMQTCTGEKNKKLQICLFTCVSSCQISGMDWGVRKCDIHRYVRLKTPHKRYTNFQ